MSIRFTGNKTALRRTTGLPSAHNAFTICGFAKLLVAAPTRTATIAYTQSTPSDSAESVHLGGGSGTGLRAADDYISTFSSDVATVTAGGVSGANWFFFALVGVGSGTNGLRLYHSTVGGTPTYVSLNNKAGTLGFEAIQFGDLPWGTDYWFDGLLAHLKVYNRILSDAELATEASRGDPGTTSSLLSYHSFSNATLATAVVPDQGTGTFTAFTTNPSTSTDMPTFSSGPTLSGSDTLPIRDAAAPTVLTSSLPGGLTSNAYSQTLLVTGDTPITWSVVSGSLPTGLSLASATGVISGTPSSAATYNFTVRATNATGTGDQALQIVIATPATVPAISTTTLQNGTVDLAYLATLEASGTAPITWALTSGSIPPGLALTNDSRNKIRNPQASGASVGTPGTDPTNWDATAAGGLAVSIVGTGVEDGLNYVDVRWNGTTSSATAVRVYYETASGVAATSGQTWTLSSYVRVVGGSTANITAFNSRVEEFNSGGSSVAGTSTSFTPTTAPLTSQRYSVTRTFNNATAAYARPQINFTFPTGVAIDITLRLAGPQLEQASSATAYADPRYQYIAGTPTTSGAYSFTLSATNGAGSDSQAYTLQIEPVPPSPPEEDGWIRLPRDAEVWIRVPRTPPA